MTVTPVNVQFYWDRVVSDSTVRERFERRPITFRCLSKRCALNGGTSQNHARKRSHKERKEKMERKRVRQSGQCKYPFVGRHERRRASAAWREGEVTGNRVDKTKENKYGLRGWERKSIPRDRSKRFQEVKKNRRRYTSENSLISGIDVQR